MKFSVLISIYSKENPAFLDQALHSIENQTLLPSEIVVVKDGPLTEALENILHEHQNRSAILYRFVPLETNLGLGQALAIGIQACQYEWIARMDGDDIAHPERFEKQIYFLKLHPDIDVLGSWISEFDRSPSTPDSFRTPPANPSDIASCAHSSNPLNHMTVVFRKSTILDAGNYQPFQGREDYDLWVRVLQKGGKIANLPEVLVSARCGTQMIARRHGLDYFNQEVAFQKRLLEGSFISYQRYCLNLLLRAFPRLFPVFILKRLYRLWRKFF